MQSVKALLILLLSVVTVFADQPRSIDEFSSENKQFVARLSGGSWKVFENNRPTEIYRFTDWYEGRVWLSSMTLILADDGRSVVAIDDYSQQEINEDSEVLFFLRDGKMIRTYKLKELTDVKNCGASVSHYRCFKARPAPTIKDLRIAVETNDFVRFVFNVDTGNLIETVTFRPST